MQRRNRAVQENVLLSSINRADFHQQTDWLVAWLRDQAVRMREGDCENFSNLIEEVEKQWVPVQKQSLDYHVAMITWEIEKLQRSAEGYLEGGQVESEQYVLAGLKLLSSAWQRFADFRNEAFLTEGGKALRQAIFRARTGLRYLKFSGIMY